VPAMDNPRSVLTTVGCRSVLSVIVFDLSFGIFHHYTTVRIES